MGRFEVLAFTMPRPLVEDLPADALLERAPPLVTLLGPAARFLPPVAFAGLAPRALRLVARRAPAERDLLERFLAGERALLERFFDAERFLEADRALERVLALLTDAFLPLRHLLLDDLLLAARLGLDTDSHVHGHNIPSSRFDTQILYIYNSNT